MTDPIIEELHQIREQLAAKFNFDMRAIVADIQASEKAEDCPVVSFAEDQAMNTTDARDIGDRRAA